ncbi:MAG: SOS response-associated peptidase [Planctomycetales bacterium]|nr:SOS response-associated peptidase [Planctomycetales bacterium]
MCGRFTLRTPQARLIEQFAVPDFPQLPLRFNIAPSQEIVVVRQHPGGRRREAVMARWGLVPTWAKDPNKGNRPINARGETAAEKPMFRTAFRSRRCLVPADGYYEWQQSGEGKQPYFIHMRDDGPFALAGLWERWHRGEQVIQSCTIITTAANPLTRPIHERMPVILPPQVYDVWLDAEFADVDHLTELLRPYDGDAMQVYPVGRGVNRPAYDAPGCIVEADIESDEAVESVETVEAEGGDVAPGRLF